MARDLLMYELEKVLDNGFKFEYNESIKSEEWFLARKEVEDETGKY